MKEVKMGWIHRLVIVILISTWLLATCIAAFIAWDLSKVATYSYSWHNPPAPLANPSSCDVYVYEAINDASFYCGEFRSTSAAVDDMISKGFITDASQLPLSRTILSDGFALKSISQKHALSYSYSRDFSPTLGWKMGGYAAAFSVGLMFILAISMKVLFFIAHGPGFRFVG